MVAAHPGRSRSVCYRCHKAAIVCVCATVERLRNRTGVVILQHPRERFHPIGTVRFAKLGLENVRVIVGGGGEDAELDAQLPHDIGLLYPSPEARLLSSVPIAERPRHLLVLDGTWSQARKLYRSNRWLARLPHFALAPSVKGQYRIRLEPNDHSLSTIEAIVEALQILEPDTPGLSAPRRWFAKMIDTQIEFARVPHPRVRRARRGKRTNAVPGELRDTPERIVLGYGEFAFPPQGPGCGRYALVYWAALRLTAGGDGEVFECFVRPDHFSADVPGDRQLGHMGFSRAQIDQGISLADFEHRWRAFLREGDVLAVWNKSTLDFLRGENVRAPEASLVLKTVYCNARKTHCGALDAVIAQERLEAVATPFTGRPRSVMGQLLPLARLLGGHPIEVAARAFPTSGSTPAAAGPMRASLR